MSRKKNGLVLFVHSHSGGASLHGYDRCNVNGNDLFKVTARKAKDGVPVIEVSTYGATDRVRVNINDATVFDGDPDALSGDSVTAEATAILTSVVGSVRSWRPEGVDDSPCPYTFAHTRHWCGYRDCRDS